MCGLFVVAASLLVFVVASVCVCVLCIDDILVGCVLQQRAVDAAIVGLSGKTVCGRIVTVSHESTRVPKTKTKGVDTAGSSGNDFKGAGHESRTVFVKNIPKQAKDIAKLLRDKFSQVCCNAFFGVC